MGIQLGLAGQSSAAGRGLYTVTAKGKHLRLLDTSGKDADDPAFSPNGRQIVARGFPHDWDEHRSEAGIYKMNADGTHWVRLTEDGTDAHPDWQPR